MAHWGALGCDSESAEPYARTSPSVSHCQGMPQLWEVVKTALLEGALFLRALRGATGVQYRHCSAGDGFGIDSASLWALCAVAHRASCISRMALLGGVDGAGLLDRMARHASMGPGMAVGYGCQPRLLTISQAESLAEVRVICTRHSASAFCQRPHIELWIVLSQRLQPFQGPPLPASAAADQVLPGLLQQLGIVFQQAFDQ